ncbi:protein ACCELERATED CELL DEATH 6-like isoform X2 [Humulus lupulus]|nr:protein ACCELERATED CELL DEATH 6-like isoform X2 [Humulus lupulus]
MEGRDPTTTFHIQHHNGEETDVMVQINNDEAIHGHESIIHIDNNNSAQTRNLSANLIENDEGGARKKYLTLGVKLYKATLRGDWETAEDIIHEDPSLLRTSITRRGQTILHLAAGTKHTHFMEKLLDKLEKEDLELPDDNDNTAFCYAVWGEKAIANIMLNKNPNLATIPGGKDMTPLYMAVLFGRSEMARFLFDKTQRCLRRMDKISIFFACINTGLYGIALEILKLDETLATERDTNKNTVLHLLAQTPSAFDNKSPVGWSKLFKSACFKCGFKRNMKQSTTLELVTRLWKHILFLGDKTAMSLIKSPSNLLFDATKLGNFEFVAALLKSYPDLIYETDGNNRTIIHYAVMYRHANIYNLVGEFGSIKDLLATFEDTGGNNVLHLAALLPPPDRLNIVSGAALQMQQELLWFEVVKKNVQPLFLKATNKNRVNPQELFTIQHKRLLRCGESWMKSTANSCMIVATLIATVVFAAAFTLPGGNNDKDGTPNEIQANKFLIFVLSDAFALLNSVIAISMFLSILVSRYTEHDFLKRLPLKLMTGLTSLFLSLITMILAFSFSIMIAYEHHGLKWVPILISMLAIIPIALFALLKFPLLLDTFRSTYYSSTVFQPTQLVLY